MQSASESDLFGLVGGAKKEIVGISRAWEVGKIGGWLWEVRSKMIISLNPVGITEMIKGRPYKSNEK